MNIINKFIPKILIVDQDAINNFCTDISDFSTRAVTSSCSRALKIYRSLMGQAAKSACVENIIEFGGYQIGRTAGSWALSRTFQPTARLIGICVSLTPFHALSKLILSPNGKRSDLSLKQKVVVSALTVGASVTLMYTLPSAMGVVGYEIGLQVGEVIGGIVGGYAGIKLLGSEERLLPAHSIYSYPIKSIQCIIADFFLPSPFNNVPVNFLFCQIRDSLAFNLVPLSKQAVRLVEGRLLEEALPTPDTVNQHLTSLSRSCLQQSDLDFRLSSPLSKSGESELVVRTAYYEASFAKLIAQDEEISNFIQSTSLLSEKVSHRDRALYTKLLIQRIHDEFASRGMEIDDARLLKLISVLPQDKLKRRTSHFLSECIQRFEESLVGLDLKPGQRKSFLDHVVGLHIEAFNYYVALSLIEEFYEGTYQPKIDEELLKPIYVLLAKFLPFYYSEIVGVLPAKTAKKFLQGLAEKQVDGGSFSG